MTETKKEFQKITGCIHIELEGQKDIGSHKQEVSQLFVLVTLVKCLMHSIIMNV